MDILENPIPGIQNAKHNGVLLFSSHALTRMMERSIRVDQIEQALNCSEVEIIENYPQIGRPSPDCLILGKDYGGLYMHMVVTYPVTEVINAYEPTPPKWITPRKRGER